MRSKIVCQNSIKQLINEYINIVLKVKVKKTGLILNMSQTKITASSPVTSWQIDGKTLETVTVFIFLGSKVTADSDCSHEIKRRLLLGRKAMTNLDKLIKRQRHHFAYKGPI